jgi:hypothetical protein
MGGAGGLIFHLSKMIPTPSDIRHWHTMQKQLLEISESLKLKKNVQIENSLLD